MSSCCLYYFIPLVLSVSVNVKINLTMVIASSLLAEYCDEGQVYVLFQCQLFQVNKNGLSFDTKTFNYTKLHSPLWLILFPAVHCGFVKIKLSRTKVLMKVQAGFSFTLFSNQGIINKGAKVVIHPRESEPILHTVISLLLNDIHL